MPYKPGSPCSYPGCARLAYKRGYCEEHLPRRYKEEDSLRGNSNERGYNYRWQKASRLFLQDHPLCVECLKEGRVTAATIVDHIEPHKGNQELFWDPDNWQPLCELHHNQKSATE